MEREENACDLDALGMEREENACDLDALGMEPEENACDLDALGMEREECACDLDALGMEREEYACDLDAFGMEREEYACEREAFGTEREEYACDRDAFGTEPAECSADAVLPQWIAGHRPQRAGGVRQARHGSARGADRRGAATHPADRRRSVLPEGYSRWVTTWCLKANETRVSLDRTASLADNFGFIARSLFGVNNQRVTDATVVHAGDTLHFYYVQRGKDVHPIGSFGVVTPELHRRPDLFGEAIKDTGLFTIVGPALVTKLEAMRPGYEPDPVLRVFTGWPVVKWSPKDMTTPKYTSALFPGFRQVLARYGS